MLCVELTLAYFKTFLQNFFLFIVENDEISRKKEIKRRSVWRGTEEEMAFRV
jgi:hypothetical protein